MGPTPSRSEDEREALPEADATPDEAFELGRVAGYDEAYKEISGADGADVSEAQAAAFGAWVTESGGQLGDPIGAFFAGVRAGERIRQTSVSTNRPVPSALAGPLVAIEVEHKDGAMTRQEAREDEHEELVRVIEEGWRVPTWDGLPIERKIAAAVLAAGYRKAQEERE